MTGSCFGRQFVLVAAVILHGLLIARKCEARDWALLAKPVGTEVFPFQGVRIQFNIVNDGTEVRRLPSTVPASFLAIKSPDSGTWRMLKGNVVIPLMPTDCDRFWAHDFETPQQVRPGEQVTWTVANAAERSEGNFEALFPRPGTYTLRATWFPTDEPNPDPILTDILVVVQEPKGNDKKVFLELSADRALAEIMLEPLAAPPYAVDHGIVARDHKTEEKLNRFIGQYSDSSYADYARFALARYHLTSLRGLYYVPPGSKVAAIEQLEDIDSNKFAYGDYALSLLRRVQASRHSRDEAKAAVKLDRLFPDSFIRLEDLAQRTTLDEWRKLNPRKPVQHSAAK